jgi:L,D-transpeptidase ErfK/SrfK
MKSWIIRIGVIVLCFLIPASVRWDTLPLSAPVQSSNPVTLPTWRDSITCWVVAQRDIPIRQYFKWMDSVAQAYDTLLPYQLSEHLIARANPWLIDSLAATDYYVQMERGKFIYDQAGMIILHTGDSLGIPDSVFGRHLLEKLAATTIDVNIPEFTLRIIEAGDTLYRFPVRVGRNEKKYLAMAGRVVDLKTATGTGKIMRIERYPRWINPSDNKPYEVTRRDDHRVTACPQIPWLEPEIGSLRQGQLIHPTTNPKTLGKAYSNGCIGMREADSWRVYYHAPIGTQVVFRYDLLVIGPEGDMVRLKDIYRKTGDGGR